jgi:hypothetical protein
MAQRGGNTNGLFPRNFKEFVARAQQQPEGVICTWNILAINHIFQMVNLTASGVRAAPGKATAKLGAD